MFNHGKSREKPRASAGTPSSRLGAGTHWQGEIQAGPEGLCIEGSVEGTVLSEGRVVIAPGGLVKGTIHARQLTVKGRVEGIIKVAECLEILGTGWVEGEVELALLVVDEGGTLQGTCVHRLPARDMEPVPLVPRREERAVDRFTQSASGTHGQAPEHLPAARGFDRHRH
ncbi:MAG: polymer-forming cytoskeletal protein [Geothrix sp.]|nr:polymer-forming cytoskeletal protein [Geothrix sp.]